MTEVTDALLDEVIEKADMATPGPWVQSREGPPAKNDWFDRHTVDGSPPIESRGTQFALGVAVAVASGLADANFIALMDPLTAKALALEVRKLLAANAGLREELTRKVEAYERDVPTEIKAGRPLTEFDYRRAKQEVARILDSSMRSAALETVCLVFLDAAAKVAAWGPIVQRMLEAHHALSLDALPPGHADELAGLLEALKPEVKP